MLDFQLYGFWLKVSCRRLKTVPVAGGYLAFVDDEDFDLVNGHTWHAQKEKHTVYAYTNIQIPGKRRANGKQAFRRISMHRMLLDVPPGKIGEHRNRNGLDNQRANLRICTQAENNANKIGWGRYKYKGIMFVEKNKLRPWIAMIQKDGKQHTIGYYATPEEAARAYDAAAESLFGEYARKNF